MEKWIMFYLDGKQLAGYTVRGSFAGELDATKELLAYENGTTPDAIEVKFVNA